MSYPKKKCRICLKSRNAVFRKGSLKCNKCIYKERAEYCKAYVKTAKFRKYQKEYYKINSKQVQENRKQRKRERIQKLKQRLLEKNKIPFNPPSCITLFAYF